MALELTALVFVGYGSITFNSLAKTTLQLAAKPEMRGRVMALWVLAPRGLDAGGRADRGLGRPGDRARWALVIGGVAALACGGRGAARPHQDRPPRGRAGASGAPRSRPR